MSPYGPRSLSESGASARRGDLGARSVQNEGGNAAVGKPVGKAQMRHRERRAGVRDDEPDAFRRVIGVERNIGRARLEESEQRDIGFDSAIEQDGDPIARLHPARDEEPRHLVGPRVQLGVADVGALGRHRCPAGVAAAGLLDDVVQAFAIAPAQRRAFAEDGGRAH